MSYLSEVLADSPLAFWRLGDASGTVMSDSSGNTRNGTYINSPGLAATGLLVDDPNMSVNFDGTNDVAEVTHAAWQILTQFTVEAWINADAHSGNRVIFAKDFDGTNGPWRLRMSGSTLQLILWTSTGTTTLTSPSVGAAGTTRHVVGSWDGTTMFLHVNGVQVASVAKGGVINAATPALRIGAYGAGEFFDGRIDEVALYGSALSTGRIAAHYTAGTTSSTLLNGSAESHADSSPTVLPAPLAGEANGAGASHATVDASTVASGDVSNRVGGRSRGGIGQASWEPPVIEPPVGLPYSQTHNYDVAQAFGPVTIDGARPIYTVAQVEKKRPRNRIVVGGVDITFYRDVPTPFPGFSLIEPLMYGPTVISLPQVVAAFERPGVGALRWCRPGAPVLLQRVNPETDEVEATDYRGVVVGYDFSGSALSLQVGGEATGRAAMRNRQVPIFPARHDLGFFAYQAIQELGLQMTPRLGPETGLPAVRAFGGTSMLDHLNQIIAMSWTTGGERWTIMPTSKGIYEMRRKDRETIDGTVYNDDARTVADLHRDIAEEPNRIYMTGVTPEGMRVRFGAYPGLKQSPAPPYPMAGDAPFGQGTDDGDTLTGDGITVMVARMKVVGYLDLEDDVAGVYTSAVTRAVKELQRDMGTLVTGNMNLAAWRALYDLSATGFSLRWSRILPAAERSVVKPWLRSGSGAIMGRNPNYDATVLKVDRNVDAGTGFDRPQLREWAQAELADGASDNFVGTITFNTGALVQGEHTPGDPITVADHMQARSLTPGMNLSLPLFNGGTGVVVHVAAVTVSSDGVVSADVDTRARDAQEVWEVIARNRESRANPHREWLRGLRSSTETKDSIGIWDEVGGVLGDRVYLPSNTWVVVPVVAGQEGTVRSLRLSTTTPAEYVCAIFGREIGAGRIQALIGNPLTETGARQWKRETVRDELDTKLLLYVAGDRDKPLGYWPKSKDEADDGGSGDALLTGRWEDDAGFSYHTAAAPVLYVALFADRATYVPAGRIMWSQLEAGA